MFTPYDYQNDCLAQLARVRKEDGKTALVVMASGLGKTVTIAFDCVRWLKERGGRILYLCHQNDILAQSRTTFEAILGNTHTYGYYNGYEKNIHQVTCLFASFQTMEGHCKQFKPDEFDYIIVDEGHHTGAATYLNVIRYFTPKFLLGATATPDRYDGRNIRQVYGDEIFYLPLEEALVRGLLSPVDYRLLTDEIQLDGILNTPVGKLSIKYLNSKIFVPKRDEEIAQIVSEHAKTFAEPKIIYFANTIPHCEHLAHIIPNSFAIHSKVHAKERQVRLELFRQGAINSVLTVDCFNEGIDIPQANIVVFLRSTASPTIFLQQLGRGLRKAEGKEKVIVLDFVGNCERIKMLKEIADEIEKQKSIFSAEVKKRNHLRPGYNDDGTPVVKPMQIDIATIQFSEQIVQILDVISRIKPKTVAEIPRLFAEYSSRNILPAEQVSAGTRRKLWWVCGVCKHEWEAVGAQRVGGTGCPACCNKDVTEKNNLAVTHPALAEEYSTKNQLPATAVVAGTNQILKWVCKICGYTWEASGANRVKGHGCPACSGRVATSTHNLAEKYPELAKEWQKKNTVKPNMVTPSSNIKRWWKCPDCKHEYLTSPNKRVGEGTGCPACAGQIVTKKNCLAVTHPALARELSPKNKITAQEITAGSERIVWWKCGTCKHYWQTKIYHRTGSGSGCPRCARKKQGNRKK